MYPKRLTLVTLGIAISSWLSSTHAYPSPTGAAAFTRVGGRFYVHSGTMFGDSLISQLYALDLTKSWPTTNPTWIQLEPGPYNAYHTAGYSGDNSTIYIFGRNTGAPTVGPDWISTYDINSNKWGRVDSLPVNDTSRRDFFAATSPARKEIYIMGGNSGEGGEIPTNNFDVFDIATNKITETSLPPTAPQFPYTYAAVWLESQSSMLIIGGQYGSKGGYATTLFLYSPVSKSWTTQASTGDFAHGRTSHCAASNADGSKVAVFGGLISGETPLKPDPYAYILDTTTWVWEKISFPFNSRTNAACSIVDDNFLVWGGFKDYPIQSSSFPTPQEALAILSLSKKEWLSTYTPSPALAALADPGNNGGDQGPGNNNGENNNGDKKSGISTAAIGGIAAAGVVILLAIAFFAYSRGKKKHSQLKADTSDIDFTKADEGYDIAGHQSGDRRPRRPPPPPEIMSPALYDFESTPSLSNVERNSQQLHQPVRDSHQSFAQSPYDPSFVSPSIAPVSPTADAFGSAAGYSTSAAGYSAYSPSSTAPLVPMSEYGGTSPYQQNMQRASFAPSIGGNQYYPPPPPSVNQQQQGFVPYNSRESVAPYNPRESIAGSVYKVPAPDDAIQSTEGYHDAYGQNRLSMISNSTSPSFTATKRPPSGPQGGYGLGASASSAGAPQAIPE
ncbi:hypothetical protein BGZ76_003579 [Entomortierella beljakovae]|nr:hypothetical protein BGZ76_003579 [Entomortierella beljakovae]